MTSMRRRRRINFQLIYVVASECGPILSLSLSLRPLSVRSSVRVSARPCMIAHTLVRPSVRPPELCGSIQHLRRKAADGPHSTPPPPPSLLSAHGQYHAAVDVAAAAAAVAAHSLFVNERTDSQWLVADSSPAGRGRGQAQVQIGQTWQAGSGVVVAAAARERGPSAVATATGEER